MVIGGREFVDSGKTYVMGILNVTPDSFSDGGRFNEMDRALWHVEEMIGDGMDILDIGGESTRPGYTLLSEEEETSRVAPVIEAVKKRFDVPVSLDTYKYKVAQAGISAGADLINDIWGLKYDGGQMAETIAGSGLPCCLMHNRQNADYGNFLEDLAADLADTLRIAEAAGIRDDKIILDPGVGFAKSYEQNLMVIKNLDLLTAEFDLPVLLGTSRKRVIGTALDLPVDERDEGTAATTVIGRMKGASLFRVHDVKGNYRALKMAEAILHG